MAEPLDIGDPEQVAELKTKVRVKARSEADQFNELMQQPLFRAFVWRLLAEAQVFQPIMTGNSYTFLNEGKRQMGLWVLEQINRICPELYVTMTREATAKAKKGND